MSHLFAVFFINLNTLTLLLFIKLIFTPQKIHSDYKLKFYQNFKILNLLLTILSLIVTCIILKDVHDHFNNNGSLKFLKVFKKINVNLFGDTSWFFDRLVTDSNDVYCLFFLLFLIIVSLFLLFFDHSHKVPETFLLTSCFIAFLNFLMISNNILFSI